MAHAIEVVPDKTYKKDDRIQHRTAGTLGTVVEDQTDPLVVHVRWDGLNADHELYRADAILPAPWHGETDPRYTGDINLGKVVKGDPIYKIGDRVKLKYNRSCGTVKANSFPGDTYVPVEWDKAPGVRAIEKLADLVVLYAPRDTDPVNPNQAAIDAIEVQRQALIKEVEAVQSRLRTLTQAKKLLERG